MLRKAIEIGQKLLIAGAFAFSFMASDCDAQMKQASEVRIVFVTHGQAKDPYWWVVRNGLQAAAKMTGAKVEYFAPESWDVAQMARMIDAAVASRPDGLVVSIPNAVALKSHVLAAKKAGIPVVAIDTGGEQAKDWGLSSYVGSRSGYDSGVRAGKLMAGQGVKSAICVNHEVGNVSLDQRCGGFTDGLAPSGGQVAIVAVGLDPSDTANRVKAYLKAHPDVTGLLTLGPAPAGPVLSMLRQSGMLSKVKFGTFNLSPEVLDAIGKGEMMFGIDSQPFLMGYLPVVFLTLHAMYGAQPIDNVWTGPTFVMRGEAATVIEMSKQGFR
jgi:simple sugar transport system substrate-binding protein